MELKDKVKEDNEFVDFNQIVTELLAISSHNINEIPGMHQSKDVPKGIEPSVVKEVARSSVEKKSEVKEAVEQKKEAQVLNFSSYCTAVAKCSRLAACRLRHTQSCARRI
eukprot:TRINITY_DN4815_c0_g1_i3.p4 TRINITY_DN4815_c0_g1~~TRINITY_DN4815_c0_g1_i3.p4  ORF type:complete len:110 (-),score=30.73 TRINITY_DN4815_c0_g1_i3:470-799(-)